MSALLGIVVIGVIVAWFWTHRNSHRSDLTPRPKTGGGLFGRGRSDKPLERVADPRLLAAILMQQLVRTGAPVTGAEKERILALLADPLGVPDPQATYESAWTFTDRDRSFSAVADEMLPSLRRLLDEPARRQLVDMLGRVAAAYGEPSELQVEAIQRLEYRLTRAAEAG